MHRHVFAALGEMKKTAISVHFPNVQFGSNAFQFHSTAQASKVRRAAKIRMPARMRLSVS